MRVGASETEDKLVSRYNLVSRYDNVRTSLRS